MVKHGLIYIFAVILTVAVGVVIGGYLLVRPGEAPPLEPDAWQTFVWEGGIYLPPLSFEYPSEWALSHNRYRTPEEQKHGLPGEVESLTVTPCQELFYEGGNTKGIGLPGCDLEGLFERLNGISIGTGRQTECRPVPEATRSQCVDGVLVSTMSTDSNTLSVFDRLTRTISVTPIPTTTSAELDAPFTLDVSGSAMIMPQSLLVTFLNVSGDSRCPADVVCVRAGTVTVEVMMALDSREKGLAVLSLGDGEFPKAIIERYTIELLNVFPVPRHSEPKPRYSAMFRVTRTALDRTGNKQNERIVSGVVNRYQRYCGGVSPPQYILDQLTRTPIEKVTDQTLYAIPVPDEYPSEPVTPFIPQPTRQFRIDGDGNFRTLLTQGSYCVSFTPTRRNCLLILHQEFDPQLSSFFLQTDYALRVNNSDLFGVEIRTFKECIGPPAP